MLVVEYDTQFRLPPLTLQPLAENAVKHGMNPDAGLLHVMIRTCSSVIKPEIFGFNALLPVFLRVCSQRVKIRQVETVIIRSGQNAFPDVPDQGLPPRIVLIQIDARDPPVVVRFRFHR